MAFRCEGMASSKLAKAWLDSISGSEADEQADGGSTEHTETTTTKGKAKLGSGEGAEPSTSPQASQQVGLNQAAQQARFRKGYRAPTVESPEEPSETPANTHAVDEVSSMDWQAKPVQRSRSVSDASSGASSEEDPDSTDPPEPNTLPRVPTEKCHDETCPCLRRHVSTLPPGPLPAHVITNPRKAEFPDAVQDVCAKIFMITTGGVQRTFSPSQLNHMHRILEEAQECKDFMEGAAAWAGAVCAPMLRTVLWDYPGLRHKNISAARVLSDIGCSGVLRPPQGLMDYAITLLPQDGSAFMSAVEEFLEPRPLEQRSVNPTPYASLMFRPAGLFVRVLARDNHEDAHHRLASWANSHVEFVRRLPGSPDPIPMPIVITMDHEWTLYFVCDRGSSIELLKAGTSIGGTKDIDGIATLYLTLECMAEWIMEDFKEWACASILDKSPDECAME